jgi:hypothetical protein
LITRRIALLLVVAIAVFLFGERAHPQQSPSSAALQEALTEQALAFLRNECNILVTGNPPPEGLVPRQNGMTRLEISGEQLIAASLKSREDSLQHGKHYASIEITLNPAGIEKRDGKVIVHAVDDKVERFIFDPEPSKPIPHIYEESTHHDFIFLVTPLSANMPHKPYTVKIGDFEYALTKDITEPQLLKVSDEEHNEQEYSRPPAVPLKVHPPIDGPLVPRKP